MIADISYSGHRYSEPDDPRHLVERSQMVPRDREDVECRQASRVAPSFHVELSANSTNESGCSTFRRKHPAEKEQIACLHRLYVGAEWFRRHR